ncbi:MAG: FGGY-family carbohydrate kinase [Euryarchaeota archaeon]|nr:FGGY-family carbohydrate kinase [Euryarchaeota archaeon]MDE1837483.1 FGGY-family carbohydrate kinase [Euryarchaeota archaeon]MDE2045551.1 FGGY-family carbohydrate kinase [Thermoplasmata archaeon]
MSGREHPPLFLGIDLGTSSVKVALTNVSGKVLGGATSEYRLVLLPNGGVEQDPGAWWGGVVRATKGLLERSRADPGRVAAIAATGQWSGTVAVDAKGKPLRRAIVWMDTRGEPFIRTLTGGFPSVSGYRLDKLLRWLRRTGGAPAHAGKDSLAHILYLREKEPEVYRSAFCFLEPKDWINHRLTGNFSASWDNTVVTWVTDNRDASHVVYDPSLFRMAGLAPQKFPPLKSSVEKVGGLAEGSARELGLRPGTPVVAGAGDMQASLVGSWCTRPYQFHLYLGTSSWLTAHVPFQRTDIFHNIASLPGAVPGSFSIIATQESAGSSLTYARDLLFGHGMAVPSYPELDALASKAPAGAGGILFAPWLYGERAPVEDRNLRGALFNLSLSSDRGRVLRAVMEGVAYNTRWILGPVEKLAGHRADPIRVGGGGANSPLWCQILASVLDRRVEVLADPGYATARGAALLGAVGSGATTFDAVAGAATLVRTFSPDPKDRPLYDQMFERFRRFHATNTKLYRELNSSDS